MTRWDLVYKWADPETRSIVDAVTSALENCDRKLTEAEAASPAALDALERAVIDAAIRIHDSQQASGSTLAPGERGIGGQMMTAWIRAEPFEELLDATYALLRERDLARLAHREEERSGE